MADLSHFESRTGKLNYSPELIYTFGTDIRNFERFIPDGTISNWVADRESCTFNVSVIGPVSVRLVEKEINKKIGFEGDAIKKNDFSLAVYITKKTEFSSDVMISVSADLNPMLKMMVAKPVARFLDRFIDEMEKFEDWHNVRK